MNAGIFTLAILFLHLPSLLFFHELSDDAEHVHIAVQVVALHKEKERREMEEKDSKGKKKLILEAQLAVDGDAGKYPKFKGNVATVYTHPLSQGGASNSHYNGNAQTYMDVGLAMGKAMVRLLDRHEKNSNDK